MEAPTHKRKYTGLCILKRDNVRNRLQMANFPPTGTKQTAAHMRIWTEVWPECH